MRSGTVSGQLCVRPSKRHAHELRLVYSTVAGTTVGPAQAVSAEVSRTSASSLLASFLPAAIDRPYRSMRWQVISALRSAAYTMREMGMLEERIEAHAQGLLVLGANLPDFVAKGLEGDDAMAAFARTLPFELDPFQRLIDLVKRVLLL